MIDIHLPTTDGHRIVLSRYADPEPDIRPRLNGLNLTSSKQPPPKVYPNGLTKDGLLLEILEKTTMGVQKRGKDR